MENQFSFAILENLGGYRLSHYVPKKYQNKVKVYFNKRLLDEIKAYTKRHRISWNIKQLNNVYIQGDDAFILADKGHLNNLSLIYFFNSNALLHNAFKAFMSGNYKEERKFLKQYILFFGGILWKRMFYQC